MDKLDKTFERIQSNFQKYVANYNDQLLCCMEFIQVNKMMERSPHKMPSQYRFIKQSIGNGKVLDPLEMSNAFSPPHNAKEIFNTFNNAQLTSLTPLVEIFTKSERTGNISPIPLQNIHGAINVYSNHSEAYAFLGLKDIVIELKGDSFETRKKDIDISITFYGNNLSVFQDGSGKFGEIYLPLIHPFYKTKGTRHRLMLKTGWNDPTPKVKESLFPSGKDGNDAKLDAIKRQKVIYELQYTKHMFNFEQDGSFTVQVDYVSSIEDGLQDINYTEISPEELDATYPLKVKKVKKISSAQAKLIDDFIRENHSGASIKNKERIYNYFASEPKKMNKRMSSIKETIQDRNSTLFMNMIRLMRTHKLNYTVCAKKSIVQNEMFCRAVHAATFASPEVNLFTNARPKGFTGPFQHRQGAYDKLVTIQEILTGLYRPSADPDSPDTVFMIEDFEKEFLAPATTSIGTTKKFFIGQLGKYRKIVDTENDLNTYNAALSSNQAHPAIWHTFEVYKLGDVLNAFIASTNNASSLKNREIVLGPIEISEKAQCYPAINLNAAGVANFGYVKSNSGGYGIGRHRLSTISKRHIIPLYNIPITYQMLQRIVAESFASTTKKRFTFFEFFNLLLRRVVKPYYLEGDPALDAGNATSKGVIRTFQKNISTKANVERKSIKELQEIFNPAAPLSPENTKQVHLTFCGPAASKVSTDKDVYRVGSANSVIKSVRFNQANTGIERARATDNAAAVYRNGQSEVIPQLYNVQMDIVGNLSFYPGYIFQLRPATIGLDANTAHKGIFRTLGISGAYFTTHVQHKIGLEGFTTKILKAYNFGAQDQ